MENPHKVLISMQKILSESKSWERPGQLSAYASLKILISELKAYVKENEITGWVYIQDKLTSLNFHVSAIYSIDEDNGHDAESHYHWALGDISTVSRNIPERE